MTDQLEQVIDELGTGYKALIDRVDQLEVKGNRPANPAAKVKPTLSPADRLDIKSMLNNPEAREFGQIVRRGQIDTLDNESGGYAVPEVISNAVEEVERRMSPIIELVRRESVSTPDFRQIVAGPEQSASWYGENDSISNSTTTTFKACQPTVGKIAALVVATEEAVADTFFDLSSFIVEQAGSSFAAKIGQAIISGNGTDKPTGFLNTAPEAVGDEDVSPERTYPALEYVPSLVSDGLGSLSTGSPEHYPGDQLIELLYRMNAAYRDNATWVCNSATWAVIRKLKDADGNYLWERGFGGQPANLLGRPVMTVEGMPDIAANSHPIALGDWQRAYLMTNVGKLLITKDDNITTPGKVRWYIRRRVGGATLNSDAAKVLKIATS